jgi:hypothetical protein
LLFNETGWSCGSSGGRYLEKKEWIIKLSMKQFCRCIPFKKSAILRFFLSKTIILTVNSIEANVSL